VWLLLLWSEGSKQPGLRSRKESEVFGWSRIPNNTESRIFLSSSNYGCPIGSFFFKSGILVEMAQFVLELLLKQTSCCVSQFPLILTAKFHSLYVKELESEFPTRKFWKVGVRYFTSDSATLQSTIEITRRAHSIIACSHHMYRCYS